MVLGTGLTYGITDFNSSVRKGESQQLRIIAPDNVSRLKKTNNYVTTNNQLCLILKRTNTLIQHIFLHIRRSIHKVVHTSKQVQGPFCGHQGCVYPEGSHSCPCCAKQPLSSPKTWMATLCTWFSLHYYYTRQLPKIIKTKYFHFFFRRRRAIFLIPTSITHNN